MAHVSIHREDLSLDTPTLVEGFPGVGLVGKIAAGHLVAAYDMAHYGTIHCDGLPEIAVYTEGDPTVRGPVRLYADTERDLLVLQSDAPVSPAAADSLGSCLIEWFQSHNVTPIFLSGMPAEKGGVPDVYGIATGDGSQLLSDADIEAPNEPGAVTGPLGSFEGDTEALIEQAEEIGQAKEKLAKQMREANEDSTSARPLGMDQ
jgi:uncharacterized protein